MIKSFIKIPIIGLFCLYLQSCAVWLESKNDPIDFLTSPSGADVYIKGKLVGQTPLQYSLKKGTDYRVSFMMDGHHKSTVYLYNAGRQMQDSIYCTLDATVGWITFGVIQRMARKNKRCHKFHTDVIAVKMSPIGLGEYILSDKP